MDSLEEKKTCDGGMDMLLGGGVLSDRFT